MKDMFQTNEEMDFVYSYEKHTVLVEKDLIITVLINLLDNAVKASEPGSTIEIFGKIEEDGYRFGVKDYGVGIPAEEVQKITQAFYMVDKSRSRSKNGAGLGLALCAEILTLHESKLCIESMPGQGTTMSFLIQSDRKEEQHEKVSH